MRRAGRSPEHDEVARGRDVDDPLPEHAPQVVDGGDLVLGKLRHGVDEPVDARDADLDRPDLLEVARDRRLRGDDPLGRPAARRAAPGSRPRCRPGGVRRDAGAGAWSVCRSVIEAPRDLRVEDDASTRSRTPIASSTSATLTVRGGARRRTPGTGAFTTRPCSSAAAVMAAASSPSSSTAPRSRPRPRTVLMPASASSRWPRYEPMLVARRGASIASSSASVARAAEQASG